MSTGSGFDALRQRVGEEAVELLIVAPLKGVAYPAGSDRLLIVHAGSQRTAAADALEADVRHVLRQGRRGRENGDDCP